MKEGEFVEKLDELNKLKNEGILNENEYKKQENILKREYMKGNNSYYGGNLTNKNINNRTNTNAENNAIASLFVIIFTIIGGIWFFTSDIFKEFSTAGKELISSFEDYVPSDDYTLSETDTSEEGISSLGSSSIATSGTSTYSNKLNTQTEPANKRTYSINERKVAKILTESIFENNLYVGSKEVEKYALTVMSYQTESNNPTVGSVESGQEWVIVNMKFENMSDSTVVINKNDFKIVDGANRYGYQPYYKHLDTELDAMEIRAGQSATFSVRFVYYKDYEMFLRYYNIDFDPEGYGYIDIKLR